MFTAIRYNLGRLTDFSGREDRATFWWYFLFVMILNVIVSIGSGIVLTASIVGQAMSSPAGGDSIDPALMETIVGALVPQMVFSTIVAVANVILLAAAFVRRLHDGGFPGWIAGVSGALYLGNIAYGWVKLDEVQAALLNATTPEQLEAAAYATTGPVSILLGWLPILALIIFGVWPSRKHDNRWGAYVPPAARATPATRDPASIKTGDE